MISLYSEGIFLLHGSEIVSESQAVQEMCMDREKARHETITYNILKSHNTPVT